MRSLILLVHSIRWHNDVLIFALDLFLLAHKFDQILGDTVLVVSLQLGFVG